jgi:hypothetical protein
MRRGTVMTRAGDGVSVVKRRGVNLAHKPGPDGDADEQEGNNLTRFTGDHC